MFFQLGSTAVGIQTTQGVVLAVEKRVNSSLLEPSSIHKIVKLDDRKFYFLLSLLANSISRLLFRHRLRHERPCCRRSHARGPCTSGNAGAFVLFFFSVSLHSWWL